MHLRRKYRMANSIEVVEFNSSKCPGKSRPRRAKTKPTPEAVAKNNQRRKQREAGRMVEKYFNRDDLVLTLTFREECRPECMKETKNIYKKLYTYLKREYGKRYYELFWMRNIEVGPRKGWHIHMIVNRIEGAEFLIKDFWRQFGGVYVQYIQDLRDQGKDIGEYISKAPITCERVSETSWSHSRNIDKVQGEDRVITGHRMSDQPRVPKGWYLDKNTAYSGESIDGYPFRTYTLRRLKPIPIDHRLKPSQIRKLQKAKKRTKKCKKRS